MRARAYPDRQGKRKKASGGSTKATTTCNACVPVPKPASCRNGRPKNGANHEQQEAQQRHEHEQQEAQRQSRRAQLESEASALKAKAKSLNEEAG